MRRATSLDDLSEDMLATVAHELRAPVQAIAGWAELLRRGTLDSEQSMRAIETIARAAAAQAAMIDDLLDRCRIRRGEFALKRERVDIALLVVRASEAIFPLACAKGIALDVRPGGAPHHVLGDVPRLEQVMRNLLTNAVKFSPNDSRIRIVVTKATGEVRISVTDAGVGIRPEFLPHVFERFRCDDREHGRRGLGLGLAIARHIVQLHGGSIAARSEGEGRGSTFAVILPSA